MHLLAPQYHFQLRQKQKCLIESLLLYHQPVPMPTLRDMRNNIFRLFFSEISQRQKRRSTISDDTPLFISQSSLKHFCMTSAKFINKVHHKFLCIFLLCHYKVALIIQNRVNSHGKSKCRRIRIFKCGNIFG